MCKITVKNDIIMSLSHHRWLKKATQVQNLAIQPFFAATQPKFPFLNFLLGTQGHWPIFSLFMPWAVSAPWHLKSLNQEFYWVLRGSLRLFEGCRGVPSETRDPEATRKYPQIHKQYLIKFRLKFIESTFYKISTFLQFRWVNFRVNFRVNARVQILVLWSYLRRDIEVLSSVYPSPFTVTVPPWARFHPLQGWFHPLQGWFHPLQGWFHPLQGWLYTLQGWLYTLQGWLYTLQGWLYTLQGWLFPYGYKPQVLL